MSIHQESKDTLASTSPPTGAQVLEAIASLGIVSIPHEVVKGIMDAARAEREALLAGGSGTDQSPTSPE